MSIEGYFDFEERSPTRHEYWRDPDGEGRHDAMVDREEEAAYG